MKNITKFTCMAALGATLAATSFVAFVGTASAGCCGGAVPMADGAKTDAKVKPYPLDTCIVSGEKLDADAKMKAYTFVYEGQEIKLCCKGCKKKFDKSPETYMKKLSEAPAKK